VPQEKHYHPNVNIPASPETDANILKVRVELVLAEVHSYGVGGGRRRESQTKQINDPTIFRIETQM